MKPWVQSLLDKYKATIAHTFILHGNLGDYVEEQWRVREYLAGKVFDKRQMVIFYDRSKGISFQSEEMRRRFYSDVKLPGNMADPSVKKKLIEESQVVFAREPSLALPMIEEALLHPEFEGQVVVIIDYPELLLAENDYSHMSGEDRISLATILRWANGNEFSKANNAIILCSNVITDLHSSLRAASNKIEAVEIPYPEHKERLAYIEYLIKEHEGLIMDDEITPSTLASMTGGLSCILIEDIFLRALQADKPLSLALVKERKDSIIAAEFAGLLEIIDPERGFESVGGLEHVKTYLRQNVIRPLRGEANKRRASRGVLFTGPPGTGKTMIALALAKEAQVNFVKLNIGRLLNAYVGTSERNLELALNCIRSLKPTIVFVDEIDQQLQRGSGGDSGVSRRIFARILDAMSTDELGERGEVFWVAATNSIRDVDPALRRQGRFDKIIPFIPGSAQERIAVVAAVLKRNKVGANLNKETTSRIAKETNNYTGSDMEGVCVKAMELAEDAGHPEKIEAENILEAIAAIPPSTPPDELKRMIDESVELSNDLTLLPPELREQRNKLLNENIPENADDVGKDPAPDDAAR